MKRLEWIAMIGLCLALTAVSACGTHRSEVIQPDNLDEVTRLARWGEGRVLAVAYSNALPGEVPRLAMATTTGIHVYDAGIWVETRSLDTLASTIAWSPDGRQLALGDRHENTSVWDVEADEIVYTLSVTTSQIIWSPDAQRLALGVRSAAGPEVQIRDATTGELLRSFSTWVGILAWSPDGRSLAIGSGQSVHIVDAQSGEVQHTIDVVAAVPLLNSELLDALDMTESWNLTDLSWHPDGQVLAIGGSTADGTEGIVLWELGQGTARAVHPPGIGNPIRSTRDARPLTFRVNNLAWSPDGQALVANAAQFTFLWNPQEDTWCVLGAEEMYGANPVTLLSWDPRGTFAVSAVHYGTHVNVWDVSACAHHEWRVPSYAWDVLEMVNEAAASRAQVIDLGDPVHALYLSWSPTSQYLAIAEGYGGIAVWDRRNDQFWSLSQQDGQCWGADRPAWSPDGRMLADHIACQPIRSVSTNQVRIWSMLQVDASPLVLELEGVPTFGAQGDGLSWSRDGQTLAVLIFPYRVALWDTHNWSTNRVLVLPEEAAQGADVTSIAFGGDEMLATSYADGAIRLWNTASGQVEHILYAGEGVLVERILWSPCGDRLAALRADGAVIVWSRQDWGVTQAPEGAVDAAWGPDGQMLATVAGRTMTWWDTSDWSLLRRLEVCPVWGVESVDWSPDGCLVAVTCSDNTVELWAVR